MNIESRQSSFQSICEIFADFRILESKRTVVTPWIAKQRDAPKPNQPVIDYGEIGTRFGGPDNAPNSAQPIDIPLHSCSGCRRSSRRQTNINFDERFPVGQSEQFIVNCAESLLRHIFSRDNQGTCATGNILAKYLCIIRGRNDAAFE